MRAASVQSRANDATIEVSQHQMTVEYHDYEADVDMLPWLTNPHGAEQVHRDSDIAPNITSVKYHGGDPSGMVFNSLITSAGAYEPRVYACSCKFPIPRLMLKALRLAAHAYTWRVNHQDIQILSARRKGLEGANHASASRVRRYGAGKNHSMAAQ